MGRVCVYLFMSSANHNVPRDFSQFLTASISVRVRVSQIYPPQFSLVWHFMNLDRFLCFSWTKWRVDFLWKDIKEHEQISVLTGPFWTCCSVPKTVRDEINSFLNTGIRAFHG